MQKKPNYIGDDDDDKTRLMLIKIRTMTTKKSPVRVAMSPYLSYWTRKKGCYESHASCSQTKRNHYN